MVLRSSIILLITLLSVLFKTVETSEPDAAEKEFFTLQAVVKFLDKKHYAPRSIDDTMSAQVYHFYLESLDPSKRFLTQSDLDLLDDYTYDLDDEITVGSFKFFDLSVAVIDAAIDRSEDMFSDIIEEDFTVKSMDSIILNSDSRGYAFDYAELREFWRKLVRYETILKVIDLRDAQLEDEEELSDAELVAKAKESVVETFESWFKRLQDLRRSDRFEDYLNAITSTYDPHSNYFSPREKESFDQEMYGTYEGIGARLIPEGDLTKVTQIIPGGPAWKQQELEVNDFIIKVAEDGEPSKDVRGWRQDDVIDLIRGKKGTKVVLGVQKADGSVTEIRIVRDQVILEEGNAKSLLLQHGKSGPEIGYILLPKFYFESGKKTGCAEDVARELKKLTSEGAKGLILDLRNNGGGSLSEVVDMTGLFFEEGPVVQVKSRDRKPYILRDQDPEVQYDGPLIVLVNHMSASASEIIAAALQDYDRAIIVGSNSTFGKGTVQRFQELDQFVLGNQDLKPLGEVKITTQKFYRVDGGSTQLKGVIPDIVLPMPYNHIKVGEKELETPLQWSEIDPVPYHKNSMSFDREQLMMLSKERIAKSEAFQVVEERSQVLSDEEKSDRKYLLDVDAYRAEVEKKEAEGKRFREVFHPIDSLYVSNLQSNIEYIEADDVRLANNQDFVKDVKKDIYIEEAMYIMLDMIAQLKEKKYTGVRDGF